MVDIKLLIPSPCFLKVPCYQSERDLYIEAANRCTNFRRLAANLWGQFRVKSEYRQVSNIRRTKSQHLKYSLLSCDFLCQIPWSQMLSREWRCSWSSANRQCSNYIWVIDNFIAYQGETYIRGFTVIWTKISNSRGLFNSYPPGQDVRHFADDIFRRTFMNEKFCILIKISVKFVPKGPIDNNPALV